jgi:hypothetical protein
MAISYFQNVYEPRDAFRVALMSVYWLINSNILEDHIFNIHVIASVLI